MGRGTGVDSSSGTDCRLCEGAFRGRGAGTAVSDVLRRFDGLASVESSTSIVGVSIGVAALGEVCCPRGGACCANFAADTDDGLLVGVGIAMAPVSVLLEVLRGDWLVDGRSMGTGTGVGAGAGAETDALRLGAGIGMEVAAVDGVD